ncbi:MAG TPA: hypothetical protein VMF05_12085 [Stellaceae bacterium]|nr:hypothetical protein [Stellaceae bacterium]
MPLTMDEKLLALSRQTIAVFDKANGGVHPGFRPAHAKGILLSGVFTPSPQAATLTRAPHLTSGKAEETFLAAYSTRFGQLFAKKSLCQSVAKVPHDPIGQILECPGTQSSPATFW